MSFVPAHKALPPSLCPPVGVNEGSSSVMTPGPSGPRAGIVPLSRDAVIFVLVHESTVKPPIRGLSGALLHPLAK